jgi:hypothetical protein
MSPYCRAKGLRSAEHSIAKRLRFLVPVIALARFGSLGFRADSGLPDHFLGYKCQELPVTFTDLLQKLAEVAEEPSVLAGTAPREIQALFVEGEIGELGRFLTIIEELIERNFQSARHFFQRFNGWNSVAVFDARNIAAEQSGALLDISLR